MLWQILLQIALSFLGGVLGIGLAKLLDKPYDPLDEEIIY